MNDTQIVQNKTHRRALRDDVSGKAIPVTGRGIPYSCETSRLPHFF
jgi:hypothetical protein